MHINSETFMRPVSLSSIDPALVGPGDLQAISDPNTSHASPPGSFCKNQSSPFEPHTFQEQDNCAATLEASSHATNRQQKLHRPLAREGSQQQDKETEKPARRQQTGRKPQPIEKRSQATFPRSGNRRMSFTREAKLAVIRYMEDRANWKIEHRSSVRIRSGQHMEHNWRPPTDQEVAAACSIPAQYVSHWWTQRHEILAAPKGSRHCYRKRVQRNTGLSPEPECATQTRTNNSLLSEHTSHTTDNSQALSH